MSTPMNSLVSSLAKSPMSTLIAVTSQNRKTVTGHAGRCRKFWLYPVQDGQIGERHLVELSMEQTFHGSHGLPPGLENIRVFITQGMGQGMVMRLAQHGVTPYFTLQDDPDVAVQAFLRGEPSAAMPVETPHHHHHEV